MIPDDRIGPLQRPEYQTPGNGVSLHGPGGFRLSATGPIVIIILLLIAGFGGLGYILRDGFSGLAADRGQRMMEHAAIQTAQNELACVLALPQEARPAALGDPRGICHYATMIFDPRRK